MVIRLKKFNILVAGIILVVLTITAFVIKNITAPKATEENPIVSPTLELLPTIDADVVVDLQFTNNNKAMILTVNNIPEGVESIDYEISYLTASNLPKGNIGSIKVEGKREISRSGEELTLGTCSRGKCVYYEGISSVNLSLKFKKSDGSASIFQKDYNIE